MFVRRTNDEIAKLEAAERARYRSPKTLILGSLGIITVVPLALYIRGTTYTKPFDFEMSHAFALGFALAAFYFALSYYLQLRRGPTPGDIPGFWVCDKCLTDSDTRSERCTCGGRFEPGSFYRWIPDREA